MLHNEVKTLARELLSAYETGEMVAIPPSGRPGFDLNTAYEVEATLKQFREAGGQTLLRETGSGGSERRVNQPRDGSEPSAARLVMPIRPCGACSNLKPWFGPTCTTTRCITVTATPPR